jgi:hypothetical protein
LLSIAAALGAWEYTRMARPGRRPMMGGAVVLAALDAASGACVRWALGAAGLGWVAMLVPLCSPSRSGRAA